MNDITRDIILDVTEKLIYRHGIAATGMDFLVKTAGVSRKSIYRYFANKDELVIAALQRRDARWMHWLRAEVERRRTAHRPRRPRPRSTRRASRASTRSRPGSVRRTFAAAHSSTPAAKPATRKPRYACWRRRINTNSSSTCSNCVKPMARPSRNGRPRNC